MIRNEGRGAASASGADMPAEYELNKLLSETIIWDILASIADAVITIDEDHRIVYCNKVAEKMFGYSFSELVGTDVTPLIPEPYGAEHRSYVNRYIRTREGHVIGKSRECFGKRKDGASFPVEISYSVSETAGRLYFTAVLRDISQRKEMEREMRFMEKLANVGKAIAHVVHEIRKPLVVIGGFAMQVAGCSALEQHEKERHKLQIVVDEVKRLEALLSGIRLLTRPPASSSKQSVQVNDLIRETLELLEPMLQGQKVDVRTELSAEPVLIMGDPDQLKQVFLNLFQNALDAMEGTGSLNVLTRNNALNAEIEIRDTGPGIPPELLDKIFDPFFTTKPEGTGLGLAITSNIVHEHGGDISILPGDGAVFLVSLPLKKS